MRPSAIVIFGLAAFLVVDQAAAGTWYVEKDETGDYTVIQDAIDAAASGDTIRIGPGRYDDFTTYTFPGGDYPIIAFVDKERLTIIGREDGLTVLGPEASGGLCQDYYSIAIDYWSAVPGGRLEVSNIRTENVCAGFYSVETGSFLDARDCWFVGGTYGIRSYDSMRVTNCRFEQQSRFGGLSFSQADTVEYRSCVFRVGDNEAVHMQGGGYRRIAFCEIEGDGVDGVGIMLEGGGGEIKKCVISGVATGVDLVGPSDIIISDNVIDAVYSCVDTDGEGFFLRDNVLVGGWGPVIDTYAMGMPHEFTGNHIFRGTGLAVRLGGDYYAPAGYHIDMTGNWWGTTDPDSISTWIHDANDEHDPPLDTIIDFEPFLPGPVPEEKTSLGGLKALFRRVD